jgi:hypothetical protein
MGHIGVPAGLYVHIVPLVTIGVYGLNFYRIWENGIHLNKPSNPYTTTHEA